jgi:hypothetical protein
MKSQTYLDNNFTTKSTALTFIFLGFVLFCSVSHLLSLFSFFSSFIRQTKKSRPILIQSYSTNSKNKHARITRKSPESTVNNIFHFQAVHTTLSLVEITLLGHSARLNLPNFLRILLDRPVTAEFSSPQPIKNRFPCPLICILPLIVNLKLSYFLHVLAS